MPMALVPTAKTWSKHTIQPFLDGFMAGGYRLPSLLKSIVTSPQFFSAPEPAGNLPKLSLNTAAP